MIEVRVTRPCARCRHVADCRPLIADVQKAALEHETKHPRTPDLEVVVDCKMYVPVRRRA